VNRRLPAAVTPGARIAVVSPASPFAREEFDAGVAEIARLGFEPVYDETVFARDARYLSGSATLRAQAFTRHWTDPGVAALIAVRGGFGSAHLLPLLDRANAEAVHRLQRQHDVAVVADVPVRSERIARPDARGAPVARLGGL
jgi:muramoyltetrapeptide carboxypeptidase LdcA involved in peptidoglycan recycling